MGRQRAAFVREHLDREAALKEAQVDTFKVKDWRFLAHVGPEPELVGNGYEVYAAPTAAGGKAIRCMRCGMLSAHPRDVAERYCAHCCSFHEGVPE